MTVPLYDMTTLAVVGVGFNRYHKLVYTSFGPDVDIPSPTNIRGVPPKVTPVTVSDANAVVS